MSFAFITFILLKKYTSIQFKAAFLLFIFSLNIVIGFACSIGVDMGFNSPHHHDDSVNKAAFHDHSNGDKHDGANDDDHESTADMEGDDHHDDNKQLHHHTDNTSKEDGCCNNKVVKLFQDNTASLRSNTFINPIFFTSFISSYYKFVALFFSKIIINKKYFVLGHHPPIPDIRIAIRSFQI